MQPSPYDHLTSEGHAVPIGVAEHLSVTDLMTTPSLNALDSRRSTNQSSSVDECKHHG